MTVEKPKPKQLRGKSQAQPNYHFQPTMSQWNSWSNLLLFTNQREVKVKPIMSVTYFETRQPGTNQNQYHT